MVQLRDTCQESTPKISDGVAGDIPNYASIDSGECRNTLINRYYPLISSLINRSKSIIEDLSLSIEDIQQEAFIWVAEALEGYDSSKPLKINLHIAHYVTRKLAKHMSESGVFKGSSIPEIIEVIQVSRLEHDAKLKGETLRSIIQKSPDKTYRGLTLSKCTAVIQRIDKELNKAGNQSIDERYGDKVVGEGDIVDIIGAKEKLSRVLEILDNMHSVPAKDIKRYHGIGGYKKSSIAEIAADRGVTEATIVSSLRNGAAAINKMLHRMDRGFEYLTPEEREKKQALLVEKAKLEKSDRQAYLRLRMEEIANNKEAQELKRIRRAEAARVRKQLEKEKEIKAAEKAKKAQERAEIAAKLERAYGNPEYIRNSISELVQDGMLPRLSKPNTGGVIEESKLSKEVSYIVQYDTPDRAEYIARYAPKSHGLNEVRLVADSLYKAARLVQDRIIASGNECKILMAAPNISIYRRFLRIKLLNKPGHYIEITRKPY